MIPKFHCIGMKNTMGKGLDNKYGGKFDHKYGGKFDPAKHAAELLYLEKAEARLAKIPREKFLKLWDKELIKFGDSGYDSELQVAYRACVQRSYLAGLNGKMKHTVTLPDAWAHGVRDAKRKG